MKTCYMLCLLVSGFYLAGCAPSTLPNSVERAPTLASHTSTYKDLTSLPAPAGKITASVYAFRDQTGQYKTSPASIYSTAVTQGGGAFLSEALKDSGWFIPLEREGLQNLLTERKVVRAALAKPNMPNNSVELPSLLAAKVLIEGGIVAYESNIRTGGSGAKYLGVGASEQYRVDQVTVNLRAINVSTGQILHSISTSKTVLSKQLQTGIFRFVSYQKLLELEAGYTENEPAQMAVRSAIESAVIHMIADGIEANTWKLEDPQQITDATLQRYLEESPRIVTPL